MTKIFLIKDNADVVWGIAPTLIQARRQVSWFLPKEKNYKIEMEWIS